jgi:iron complex outermembrane receptor protein
MTKSSKCYRSTVCAAALIAGTAGLGAANLALAQEQPAQHGLEEIVVTAQKRSEALKDVPIAISAFTSQDIQNAGISSAIGLNQVVSGLNIAAGGSSLLTPFLRGVGNPTLTVGNEASVAIYVDDVYVSRLEASFFDLVDIDRVEVLKGPQGTLFGRNSSGGLINIITKEPSLTDYEADVSLGYDNYNTFSQKLYLSVPITDTIAANFSLYHADQGSSWGYNYGARTPWGYEDPTVVHSKWIFEPSDDLKITTALDYSHTKSTIGISSNIYPGTLAGTPQFLTQPPNNLPERAFGPVGFWDANLYTDDRIQAESYGGYVRVDYDTGLGKFSSISSLRQENEDYYSDGYFTPLNTLQYNLVTFTRTATQEFQITSDKGSAFDWIVGFFYLNTLAGNEPTSIRGAGLGPQVLGIPASALLLSPSSVVSLYGEERTQDFAGYAQGTFHAPERTDITLGVRYLYDDVEGRGSTVLDIPGVAVGQAGPTLVSETKYYKPTYKVAVEHHFADDAMAYLSASRGFKAGTYNTLPLTTPAVKPEILDAYELGAKTEWLDHQLRLNGAFFYYNINNPQVSEIQNSVVFLTNAQSADIKGVDLDGQYAITPRFIAHFGAEYLNSHYTSFNNAPFYLPIFTPPYGNYVLPNGGNASGDELVAAPRFSANIGFNYQMDSSIGTFNFNTNLFWNQGFYWSADNFVRQKSYEVLDASLIYVPSMDESLELRLWGKNLTNTKYSTDMLEQAGTAGDSISQAPPATFGIEATYHFSRPASESPELAAAPSAPPALPVPPPASVIEAKRSFQVFFDFDKSDITGAAAKVIQSAADAVRTGSMVQLAVTGHTDTVGTAAYNQALSERRATSVKAALVADGVAAGEITTIGVGKTGLLVPTADGVREPQNRRAEIVLQ